MQELGVFLQRARQARGLTLEEMHTRTKISMRFLVAMEAGRFEELPGRTYSRAFLRLYAREVGLLGQEVLASYEAALLPPSPPAISPAPYGGHETRSRRGRSERLHVGRWVFIAALLATVLLLRWYFAPTYQEPPRPKQSDAAPPGGAGEKLESQPDLPELPPSPPAFDGQATEMLYTGRGAH